MVRPEAIAASVTAPENDAQHQAAAARSKQQMKQQRELGLIYLVIGAFMFVMLWRRGQLPPSLQARINSWFGKVVRWDGGDL